MSQYRGHKVYELDGEIYYSDIDEPTANYPDRACGECHEPNTPEGHDYCLGTLKGLMNACCGHGETSEAYVQFLDGSTVHGEDAEIIQNILMK